MGSLTVPETYNARTRVPVDFEAHELVALQLLYIRAPDDIDLVDDGINYSRSVDLAHLRLGEAWASFTNNKEALKRAGALRARMDQEDMGPPL